MKLRLQEDRIVIDYEASGHFFSIEEQKKIFLDVLEKGKPVVIKIDKLDVIDTPSLQLLVSLMKSAQMEQVSVSFEKPSLSFVQAAHLVGISKILGI